MRIIKFRGKSLNKMCIRDRRNIVSSEVIAIDRPGFGRFTTDKALQRVTILTKLDVYKRQLRHFTLNITTPLT